MGKKAIHFNGGFDVEFQSETPDLNIFKCIVQPEARTPMPHYHKQFDETVKSLVGITTVVVDSKTMQLTPGESVLIPRGSVHQIANNTDQPIEFLCEVKPGVFGYEYFREIEPILNAGGLPDMERFKKIMLSHGLVPVINFRQSLIFGLLRLIRLFKK